MPIEARIRYSNQLKWYVPLLLAGFFLYFAGIHFLALHLQGGFPQVELAVSLPPSLKIGATSQMAVYAFQKGSMKPATGLSMHVSLKAPNSQNEFVTRYPLEETTPGLYLAGISIGESMNPGDYLLNICPTEKPGMSICQVEAKVQNDLLLGVLPPETRINAGEFYSFQIAVIDSLKSLPLAGIPVRCKVKTSGGIEIVNRINNTVLNGTTEFTGYLHPLTKPGNYQFIFSSGNQRVTFSIPVFPAISPSEKVQKGFAGFFKSVVPFPMRGLLVDEDDPGKLQLRKVDYPAKPEFSLRIKGRSLNVERLENKEIDYSYMEIWTNNRLVASKELTGVRKRFSLEVPKGIPRGYPLRVVFWKIEQGKITSYDQIIPAFPHGKARGYFARISERLRFSNSALFNILYQGLSAGVVKPLMYQRRFELDQSLRRVSILVFYFLLILCGFQLGFILFKGNPIFRYFGENWKIIRQTLPVSVVFVFFYSIHILLRPIAANGFTFACLIGFSLFLLSGYFFSDFSDKFKNTRSVLISGFFLSLVLLIAQGMEHVIKFFPWLDPVWMTFFASFLYSFLFLSSLGIAGFFQIPGILARSGLAFIDGYFGFLGSMRWKGAGIQILLIFFLFGGLFFVFHKEDSFSSDIEESDQFPAKTPKLSLGAVIHNLSFEKSCEDISAFTNESIPIPDFAGFPKTFGSFGMGVRSRFLLVKDLVNIAGTRIESLRVFSDYRNFLDRFIQRVQSLRYSYANLCQEAIARVERFSFLDRKAQKDEEKILEGYLPAMTQILNLPDNAEKRIHPELKAAARFFFRKAAHCITFDQAYLQNVLSSKETMEDQINIRDWLGIQPESGESAGKDSQFLTNDQLRDVFHQGGTITLSGQGGKVNCSFLLTNEVLILNRGISFPHDFDAVNLEIRRSQPMVVELCM